MFAHLSRTHIASYYLPTGKERRERCLKLQRWDDQSLRQTCRDVDLCWTRGFQDFYARREAAPA